MPVLTRHLVEKVRLTGGNFFHWPLSRIHALRGIGTSCAADSHFRGNDGDLKCTLTRNTFLERTDNLEQRTRTVIAFAQFTS